MKKVRVMVEMDEEFIKLLNIACSFKRLGAQREDYKDHTSIDALGIAVLMEARGGYEEQVDAEIPHNWRPHLSIVHEARQVIEGEPAPVPPKLPTGYQCPQCMVISVSERWNKATREDFKGRVIVKIEEHTDSWQGQFTCPDCNKVSNGEDIQKIG